MPAVTKPLFRSFVGLFFAITCFAVPGNTYLGTPLFDYDVEKNRLPHGDYSIVRSYRKTTQLLVSRNYWMVVLYTDRENYRDSHITSVTWSRLSLAPPRRGTMEQAVFSSTVTALLEEGRETGDGNFPGLEEFLKAGKEGGVLVKNGSTYRCERADEEGAAVMEMDFLRGDLSIRKKIPGNGQRAGKVVRYPVYVRETRDREIRRLINRYNLRFRKPAGEDKSSITVPKS